MDKGNIEVKSALIEVRKAYRLLWLFHKRVFDIINVIKDHYGIEYYYSIIDNRPGQASTDILSRWTWDMLTMQRISFLFLNCIDKEQGHDYPQRGDALIDLILTVDSGRDYKNYRSIDADPTLFKRVEECETTLEIYVSICTDSIIDRTNWYYDYWRKTEYPVLGECQKCETVPNIKVYGEKFALELLDSKAVINRHMDEFADRVREKTSYDLANRKFCK